MAKKFLTSISICYVQEKNPFSFFSQICLFQTFYSHIYPQNVQFFLYANSNGFTFVKILNQSPAQDLSNKKNRSFLRLLWAQIFLRQCIKFWHKRAILCAPTVSVMRSPPYCASMFLKRRPKPTTVLLQFSLTEKEFSMAFVTAPSQEKAQELAHGIVRQGWRQQPIFSLRTLFMGAD